MQKSFTSLLFGQISLRNAATDKELGHYWSDKPCLCHFDPSKTLAGCWFARGLAQMGASKMQKPMFYKGCGGT
jgi:hypothetical protein